MTKVALSGDTSSIALFTVSHHYRHHLDFQCGLNNKNYCKVHNEAGSKSED